MLTVVWSPVSGQAGVTTIFCAISYYLSKKCGLGESVLMLRTKRKIAALTEVMDASSVGIVRGNGSGTSRFTFEEMTGDKNIDRLLMSYAAGLQLKGVIKENVLKLCSNLFVIEGSRSKHREIFENEMINVVPAILRAAADDYTEIVLEAESGFSALNHSLFELADKIIVCLPQNIFAIRTFNGLRIPEDKTRFVFGRYDPDSVLSARNLGKLLREKSRLGIFPYFSSINNAYSAGKLLKEFEELSCSEYGKDFEKELDRILGE